jgi:hypothetical protein
VVERARQGILPAYTTRGILSGVDGALIGEKTTPRHAPAKAAEAVRLLVEPPSAIGVLTDEIAMTLRTIALAAQHALTARRINDGQYATAA